MFNEKLNAVTKERDQLKADFEMLQAEKTNLSAELNSANEKVISLSKDLDTANKKASDSETALAAANTKVSELEAENETLRNSAGSTTATVTTDRENKDGMSDDVLNTALGMSEKGEDGVAIRNFLKNKITNSKK